MIAVRLRLFLGVNSRCTLTKVRVTCMRVCTHTHARAHSHTHIMRTAAVTAQWGCIRHVYRPSISTEGGQRSLIRDQLHIYTILIRCNKFVTNKRKTVNLVVGQQCWQIRLTLWIGIITNNTYCGVCMLLCSHTGADVPSKGQSFII